jgi:hypothetical protein
LVEKREEDLCDFDTWMMKVCGVFDCCCEEWEREKRKKVKNKSKRECGEAMMMMICVVLCELELE